MTSLRTVSLTLTLLGAAACGGDANASRAVMRDSAGITIVENVLPDAATTTWWSLSPTPEMDIGTAQGSEAEALFRVVDAVRLSDGRVVVANGGSSEVRYYRPDGSLEVSVGRQGGGPHEFGRLADLILLDGDTVAARDGVDNRLLVLDAEGQIAREFGPPAETPAGLIGATRAGGWVGSLGGPVGLPESMEDGTFRPDVLYGAFPADAGAVTDTIGRFAGSERYMHIRASGGSIQGIEITTPPFARTSTFRFHDDLLYVGTQDAPEIRVYALDGALIRIIRTAPALQPVTPELLDRFIEWRVAALPEERRADTRESLRNLPRGEFVPPYGTFLLDRTGQLWVQDHPGTADGDRWSVYDRDGARVARIALPERFTPYDIGRDWILGRQLDELDVEHVRVYTLSTDHSSGS